MNKLLSIIIPTKNRQIFCVDSVKSILEDIDDRCEVIIQDNSDQNSLLDFVKEVGADNIIYNYNEKPLSFVDNFEEALNLSSGEYFIVLGDDDSTTKDILRVVEWMQEKNIDSVVSQSVVNYIWPNPNIQLYEKGFLEYPRFTGEVRYIDAFKNLDALLKNGLMFYRLFDLPRTYHGIVKRSCINEVKKIGGRYFGGLTPDMYSTIALSCVVKQHAVIDYPFSIAGACPASATVNATVGGHSGKLNEAPHFNFRGDYHWEDTIPKYYSVETIWAETALKAIKDMKMEYLLKNFNYYKLYSYGIFLNKNYILNLSIKETLAVHKALGRNKIRHMFEIMNSFLSLGFNKIFKGGNHLIDTRDDNKISKDCIYSLAECKKDVYIHMETDAMKFLGY